MLFSGLVATLFAGSLVSSRAVSDLSADKMFSQYGIEAKIDPNLVSALNPLMINVLEQMVMKMELPLPDQIYEIPRLGKINVSIYISAIFLESLKKLGPL
jgi:hypothetical protein